VKEWVSAIVAKVLFSAVLTILLLYSSGLPGNGFVAIERPAETILV